MIKKTETVIYKQNLKKIEKKICKRNGSDKVFGDKIPQIIPLSSFYVGMGPALKCCLYTH